MNTGVTANDAMSNGDGAFYSGKVEEAARWYERALELDSTRERARQRLRDIAEGIIPRSAVPPEAGIAFGQALSMYHRGNYGEAAAYIQRAIDLMHGIAWKDAQELLNNCFSGQQAEEAYRDALQNEEEGKWPAALRDYDAAIAILPDNPIYAAARERLKEWMSQANAIQAALEKPARNADEAEKLLEAKVVAGNLLRESPRNSELRDLLDKLNASLAESALLVAMDLAKQGETREAREILRPYAYSPQAKKALKEITRRYREELKVGVELRKKELEDLRKQRALWFTLSVIFSGFAGGILLVGSISALMGNLTAGIISALSSLLPGAFVRLFTNQYRDLNAQLSNILKKTPEVEKLERLAVLSEAGLDDGESE